MISDSWVRSDGRYNKKFEIGREPSSNGYVRRIMCKRSWVRIPVLHTRWIDHFSHFCVVKNVWCLKRPKINQKGREFPSIFFVKKRKKFFRRTRVWSSTLAFLADGIATTVVVAGRLAADGRRHFRDVVDNVTHDVLVLVVDWGRVRVRDLVHVRVVFSLAHLLHL